jgi:hypothetical protein
MAEKDHPGPVSEVELAMYAAATSRPLALVRAAYLQARLDLSMPNVADLMERIYGEKKSPELWAFWLKWLLAQEPKYITPTHRLRKTNTLEHDKRFAAVRNLAKLRWMVDSFPVRVPAQATQKLRQHYWCVHHRIECVKFTVILTHEDLVCFVSGEFAGSVHDKTAFHSCMSEVLHSTDVMDDIVADTAYSGAPHITTKWEKPRSNKERAWNAYLQIFRSRIERFFGCLHNNFKFVHQTAAYKRGYKDTYLFGMLQFICDLTNFTKLRKLPLAPLVTLGGELCPCRYGRLSAEGTKMRARYLAQERKIRDSMKEQGEIPWKRSRCEHI